MRKRRIKKPETVLAWAWEIQDPDGNWGLCRWSQPWKSVLVKEYKPSDEARPVCVRMIRNREYRRVKTRKLSEEFT